MFGSPCSTSFAKNVKYDECSATFDSLPTFQKALHVLCGTTNIVLRFWGEQPDIWFLKEC